MADDDLSARQAALLDRLARRVVGLDMVVPVILALEGLQPLRRVGGQLLHLLGPTASLLVPAQDWRDLAELLEEHDGVERLLRRIEEVDQETRKPD